MKWKQFLRTWEGVRLENIWIRGFIVGLMVVVLALAALLARKDTIVTIQPFTLSEDAWVSSKKSSQSYQEAWGLALAQMIGNVNPSTVEFLKERLAPLLSPRIFQDVMNALEVQAADIKKDRVTMRFEPRAVTYEKGTVFVEGNSYVRGVAGKETSTRRVYEFIFQITDYRLEVDFLTTYEGQAKTEKVLAREQNRRNQKK